MYKINRYFDMKGNEYNYDYFIHCFANFGSLIKKLHKYLPDMEEDFIKHLLKVKIYRQGGWMLKPNGQRIRLYYTIQLLNLLLKESNNGYSWERGKNGEYIMKDSAKNYYEKWKLSNIKPNRDDITREEFIDNVSRYDPDMKKD